MQQSLAAKLPRAPVTKCQVAVALAKCQGLQGEQRLQRQTLQRALDICSKSCSPAERCETLPAGICAVQGICTNLCSVRGSTQGRSEFNPFQADAVAASKESRALPLITLPNNAMDTAYLAVQQANTVSNAVSGISLIFIPRAGLDKEIMQGGFGTMACTAADAACSSTG